MEILVIALTAAAVFSILDLFSPATAAGARQGAGFGIGLNQVGWGQRGGGKKGGAVTDEKILVEEKDDHDDDDDDDNSSDSEVEIEREEKTKSSNTDVEGGAKVVKPLKVVERRKKKSGKSGQKGGGNFTAATNEIVGYVNGIPVYNLFDPAHRLVGTVCRCNNCQGGTLDVYKTTRDGQDHCPCVPCDSGAPTVDSSQLASPGNSPPLGIGSGASNIAITNTTLGYGTPDSIGLLGAIQSGGDISGNRVDTVRANSFVGYSKESSRSGRA